MPSFEGGFLFLFHIKDSMGAPANHKGRKVIFNISISHLLVTIDNIFVTGSNIQTKRKKIIYIYIYIYQPFVYTNNKKNIKPLRLFHVYELSIETYGLSILRKLLMHTKKG